MIEDKNIRILVVDDYPQMRRLIKSCLRQLGLRNIVEAVDGEDALQVLNTEPIGFVISDWNMPKMDGLELLQVIKGSEKFKGIPVLMVTAEEEQKNILKAIKAGVDNYIIKPFDARILSAKIDTIFED